MTTQRTRQVVEEDGHDHDAGLSLDLPTMITRRRALGLAALGGLTTILAACGSGDGGAAGATTSGASDGHGDHDVLGRRVGGRGAGGDGRAVPGGRLERVNVLTESGIVRSDITLSFGTGSAVAGGRAAHDRDDRAGRAGRRDAGGGRGGLRSGTATARAATRCTQRVTNENYLRGVQAADASGQVTFTSIFPACYAGRWPHIHFEVYPSLAEAPAAGIEARHVPDRPARRTPAPRSTPRPATSRACRTCRRCPSRRTWCSRDGYSTQLGTVTGSAGSGMTVSLNVGT